MRLSNGINLPVWPADPQHSSGFDRFLVETPMNIRFVKYDSANFELRVRRSSPGFPPRRSRCGSSSWPSSWRRAAYVSPEAITFTPIMNPKPIRLHAAGWESMIRIVLHRRPHAADPPDGDFHLPMGGPEAENLHKMLSDKESRDHRAGAAVGRAVGPGRRLDVGTQRPGVGLEQGQRNHQAAGRKSDGFAPGGRPGSQSRRSASCSRTRSSSTSVRGG